MKMPVDGLLFVGNQLAAITNSGKVAVWQSVQQHWQVGLMVHLPTAHISFFPVSPSSHYHPFPTLLPITTLSHPPPHYHPFPTLLPITTLLPPSSPLPPFSHPPPHYHPFPTLLPITTLFPPSSPLPPLPLSYPSSPSCPDVLSTPSLHQVQELSPICSYDMAGSYLLLGCSDGNIYYIG